jgi:hypothetical protein
VDGDVYYQLSRIARAKLVKPPLSPIVTTDAAARMLTILLDRATVPARGQLRQLAHQMARGDGSYLHALAEGARHGPGLLADQVAIGHAFLDAAEIASLVFAGEPAPRDTSWAARTDTLAAWMRANLEDPVEGGFRYAPRDTAAVGRLKAGDKPEAANVEAALFFLRRYERNGREEDLRVAERTTHYLRSVSRMALDPSLAELVLRLNQAKRPGSNPSR